MGLGYMGLGYMGLGYMGLGLGYMGLGYAGFVYTGTGVAVERCESFRTCRGTSRNDLNRLSVLRTSRYDSKRFFVLLVLGIFHVAQ